MLRAENHLNLPLVQPSEGCQYPLSLLEVIAALQIDQVLEPLKDLLYQARQLLAFHLQSTTLQFSEI